MNTEPNPWAEEVARLRDEDLLQWRAEFVDKETTDMPAGRARAIIAELARRGVRD